MIATAHRIAPTSQSQPHTHSGNGNAHCTVAEAARFLGVSPQTVRNLVASGEVTCYRTIGGHRRIDWRSLRVYAYGEDGGENTGEGKLIGVIRVSSHKQSVAAGSSDKSSLEHQKERVRDYCLNKYGREPDEWSESVGSGLNFDRPELLELIGRITTGELRGATLVATDFTRICRFGVRMIEHLCEQNGVTIEYTLAEGEEEKTENESLVDDVLSVLTHFTAKASGRKAKTILSVEMTPESLEKAYRLYKQDYSYRQIERILDEKDSKGRKISNNVIRRNLLQHWSKLERLFGGSTRSSFEQFAERNVRPNPGRLTERLEIVKRYMRWCKTQGVAPMSDPKISRTIRRMAWSGKLLGRGQWAYRVELV